MRRARKSGQGGSRGRVLAANPSAPGLTPRLAGSLAALLHPPAAHAQRQLQHVAPDCRPELTNMQQL